MTNLLDHKGYVGSIEVSVEDRCLHGSIQFIQETVTYEGNTVDELQQAFVEAVDDYLRTCTELGREPQKAYSGTFNVRVGPELHKRAAVEASKKGMRLNEFVKIAIARATLEAPGLQDDFVKSGMCRSNR
jgi:predicted HicB family RNase H-like nuclease